jgi:transketolase
VEGWLPRYRRAFEFYGWQVIRAVDGHDAEAIKAAIELRVRTGQTDADLLQT